MKRKSQKKVISKYEVVCVRCKGSMPKMWSQAQYDRHMLKVHDIRNEIHIGADPRTSRERQLSML